MNIGLAADTGDQELLNGRTLTNAGTATWAGGGSISQSYGGTFVNLAGSSFTIDNDLEWSSDGTGTFTNAGTLIKAAGSGTTTFDKAKSISG